MTSHSLRAPWIGALIAGSAALLGARAAAAQDCGADADCGAGYRCETSSYQTCSGGTMCTRDGECTETELVCETVEYSFCNRAPCATDADCPTRMACHAQSYWECDGGMGGSGGTAGAAGTGEPMPDPDCGPDGCAEPPAPPELSCHEVPGDSVCTPRHELPCQVASDCGGGFDCIEARAWVCSGMGGAGAGGSAGAGEAGAGAPEPTSPAAQDAGAAPGDDYECHEEASGQFYCQLQELPCSADADCPDGLECKDQYIYQPCMGPVAGSGGGVDDPVGTGGVAGGIMMAPPPDGEDFECPPPVIEQRCMPPEYYGGGGGGTPAPGMPSGGSGSSQDGGVSGPTEPTTGAGGSAGSGSAGGGGSQAPGDPGGEASDDDESGHGHGHGHGHHFGWLRGCSAAGPIGADPLSILGFGLIALVLRRRARKL